MKIKEEAPDIKSFVLATKLKSKPGQFVMIGKFGFGEGPFGISSYEKPLEICVRKVGNLTNELFNLRRGDTVGIRGPFGRGYPMEDLKGKNIIIIGGGTGIAPLKPVVEYLQMHKNNYRGVNIYLGFKNPQGIIFKDEIEKWKRDFEVGITVDEPGTGFKCNTGLITELLQKENLAKNSYILSCGPPIMIKCVIDLLKAKGFKERQIYVSLERLMNCGVGKCGHCLVRGKYVCKCGPVFNYVEAKNLVD